MMKKMLLLALFVTTSCPAQVLTHPRQMGLPDSNFERPDPAEYMHSKTG
jgi:hypothetical protein